MIKAVRSVAILGSLMLVATSVNASEPTSPPVYPGADASSVKIAADGVIDDGIAGWVWTQGTEVSDQMLYGGAAHAMPTGATGTYTFRGSSVEVRTMAGPAVTVDGRVHRLGKLRVCIDGKSLKEVSQLQPIQTFDYESFSVTGLPVSNHVLELNADAGWVVVDYIKVDPPASSSTSSSSVPPVTVPGYVSVTFQLHNCFPSDQQRVEVLGNVPGLGSWQVVHGLTLLYDRSAAVPTWSGTILLPAYATLQYKYVLWDGSQILWEANPKTASGNREAFLPDGGQITYTNDAFRPGIVTDASVRQ